jgi:hypothetical protein
MALHLHHQMREQSLKLPWQEVAAACERLAEWRSFSLWVRAIVDVQHAITQPVRHAIESRCPAFLESRPNPTALESLWPDLSGWIDHHFFADAAHGGWLQALHYYYGRLPESEAIWQHWTRMDDEWRANPPERFPTFAQWQEAIAAMPLPSAPVAKATPQYIEWEAFAFWVRSLVESAGEIPPLVSAALGRQCPGFLEEVRKERPRVSSDPQWLWERLLRWIETHRFPEAVGNSWIEDLRAAARMHLRSERLAAYWANCSEKWNKNMPPELPAFEQWLAAADTFVSS